ncbi:hypothetical protein E4H12_05275 [Candidatus Thorarchaeota archaeon]|nr:MAG: hypothetical protein E4H12_05275 [Candidatus Thorarchaeota archaeon]
MEWLMSLNVVMPIVLVVVIVFSIPFFLYKRDLYDSLRYAFHDDIQRGGANDPMFQHHFEVARKDYMASCFFWIPLVYVTLTMTALLWVMLSYSLDSTLVIIIAAACVATLVTRSVSFDHSPSWIMDWQVNMKAIRNELQRAELDQYSAQLTADIQRYSEIEKERVLTDQELAEVAELLQQMDYLAEDYRYLTTSTLATQQYFEERIEEAKR